MTARFSVRAAVAAHLEEDSGEIEANRRYQPTRTPCPVYTIGNEYLTATNGKRKPKGDDNYRWIEIEAHGFAKLAGWRIWRRREEWE